MTEQSPSAGPASTNPASPGDPGVLTALGMGWHMEEMYSQLPVPSGPLVGSPPGHLPGPSRLPSYQRQLLGLDQVDFALAALVQRAPWPSVPTVPSTTEARQALAATLAGGRGGAQRRADYLESLQDLHGDLLVTLSAADARWGQAYGLGRALADTTRRGQSSAALAASFGTGRIGQIRTWLADLTSALPPHAGHAVRQSLTWWHDEVQLAARHAVDPTVLRPAQADDDAPPGARSAASQGPRGQLARQLAGRRPITPVAARVPASLDVLRAGAHRQGQVWRAVLSGEKRATDLLEPNDYVVAGRQLGDRMVDLAVDAWPALWPVLAGLVAVVVVVALVLALAVTGSPVGRTATGVATLGGAVVTGWKLLGARLAGSLRQLEAPLWGAELDRAIADAVTVPPVGPADPTGWAGISEQVAEDVAAAAGQLIPPAAPTGASTPGAAGPATAGPATAGPATAAPPARAPTTGTANPPPEGAGGPGRATAATAELERPDAALERSRERPDAPPTGPAPAPGRSRPARPGGRRGR